MIKTQGLFLGFLMILIPILVLITVLSAIETNNIKGNIIKTMTQQLVNK